MSKNVDLKQSDVGPLLQINELVKKDNDYIKYTDLIKESVDNIFEQYLEIGMNLSIVKEEELYRVNGYRGIYEYSNKEFGLSKTATKNVISIHDKFCINGELKNEYKGFSYSNLVELLSVDEKEISEFVPTMTVKETRSKKYELKINELIENLTEEKGILKTLIDAIKSYDWNGSSVSYEIDPDKVFYESKDEWYYGGTDLQIDILVNLLTTNDIEYQFRIEIQFNDLNFRFYTDEQYWNLYSFSDIKDIDKALKAVNDSIVRMDLENKRSMRNEDASDTVVDDKDEVSTGYFKLSDIDRTYIGHGTDYYDYVVKFISQFDNNFYAEYLNKSLIAIYQYSKRNKKKNPALFYIHNLNDPFLAQLEIKESNSHIKLFDGIDKFMNDKLQILSDYLDTSIKDDDITNYDPEVGDSDSEFY
jgi:hypothetical protein